MSLPRTSIAVLFGGPSAEHDVSLDSGRAIATALIEHGHEVEGWLVGRDGRWWTLPESAFDLALPKAALGQPADLAASGPWGAAEALERLATLKPSPVVFPAMHGPFGEDGQLQALLQSVGLVYCGSGPAASAVGMDKTLFKRVCASLQLPLLPWIELRAVEYRADPISALAGLRDFGAASADPRLVVKPARQGSSIGVSIVHELGDDELETAVETAFVHDDLLLVEPYLEHPRELETSVLGNSRLDVQAYGPGEIQPRREFYDYVAKYESGDSVTTAQADLDPEMAAQIRAAAVKVFLAIGASGFARVDLLLGADGTAYVSEINTIPGFTPISLFPRMTAAAGFDFGATCERIVELALERARDGGRRRLSRGGS